MVGLDQATLSTLDLWDAEGEGDGVAGGHRTQAEGDGVASVGLSRRAMG